VSKANNLTIFMCQFTDIWESQPRATFWACPDFYRDCFTDIDVSRYLDKIKFEWFNKIKPP